MLQANWKTVPLKVATLVALLLLPFSHANAQGLLSFGGQLRAAYPQCTMAAPIAAMPKTCTSTSSKSRRCHFTFAASCKKRGETKEHCTAMSGFCHGCTDAYSQCRGEQIRAAEKANAAVDCSVCNAAYGKCIDRMVQQYGGKLVRSGNR